MMLRSSGRSAGLWTRAPDLASPAHGTGLWTYMVASYSQSKHPGGQGETAWPFLTKPQKSHGTPLGEVVMNPQIQGRGTLTPPLHGRNAKMHVTFSKHYTCCDQALCEAWGTFMLRGLARGWGWGRGALQ